MAKAKVYTSADIRLGRTPEEDKTAIEQSQKEALENKKTNNTNNNTNTNTNNVAPTQILTKTTDKKEEVTFLEKIANVGLTIPTAIGNKITSGLEKGASAISGKDVNFGRTNSKDLAQTTAGKALGGAIVGTGVALAGTAIAQLATAGNAIVMGNTPNIAKAATGKLVNTGRLLNPSEVLRIQSVNSAINTKTATTFSSYLTKITATAKNPMVTLGLIGTAAYTSLFWGPNEKGDALTTLTIAQGQAARNGDVEMVKEIDDLIQESLKIAAGIPVIGFIKAELAKFEAAAKTSEVYRRQTEKIINEKNENIKNTTTPLTNWDAIDKERKTKKDEENKKDEEYYKRIEENRLKAKKEERKEDEKYWEDIANKNRLREEEKRKEDQLYYEELAKKKKEEEEKYWENIKKQKEAEAKSALSFGLL